MQSTHYLSDRHSQGSSRLSSKRGIIKGGSIVPNSANKVCALVSLSAGVATSLSAVLNNALRRLIYSGTWTVTISFGGAGILSLIVALPSLRRKPSHFANVFSFVCHRWYNSFVLISGLLGMGQALVAAYLPSQIGIALMVVGMLLGQLSSSLVVDRYGWFWVHRLRVSWWSIAGCLTLLVGACLYRLNVIIGYFNHKEGSSSEAVQDLIFFLVAIVYGVSKTIQTALNRKLTSLIGARRYVTSWAFCSGTLMILPFALARSLHPNFSQAGSSDWWKFLAPPFALLSVVASVTGAQYLGFASALCWQVLGQLMLSMPLDHFGWLELKRRPIDMMNIFGAVVVLLGVGQTLIGKQKALALHNSLIISASDLPGSPPGHRDDTVHQQSLH